MSGFGRFCGFVDPFWLTSFDAFGADAAPLVADVDVVVVDVDAGKVLASTSAVVPAVAAAADAGS